MKTRFLTLLIASLLTCTIWASNVITYTASSKLTETTSSAFYGLYENAFNVSITSHTFSNGTGTITFSGDVTSIGYRAFSGCSGLTSVTIPESVTSIGYEAFSGCSGLTSVIWNAVNYVSNSSFDEPFSDIRSQITSFTIGDEVETIPKYLCYWMEKLTSVTIPNSVTSIGDYAFRSCYGLTSVTIGNSVTSIGYEAFSGCSGLTSVTIPESVTSIGYQAFDKSGITSVVWNAVNCASPSSESASPFYGIRANITNFTIGDEVETIPKYLCSGMTKLTSVTIPNSVTSIGFRAFEDCSGLTSVNYTGTIADWCNITFGSYESNPTYYAHHLLIDSVQITDLVIPNSVTSIGYYAFSGCSGLISVTIPNSVTNIGTSAFYGCSALTSITIPNSVTSIGVFAFFDCSRLTSVTIGNSVTSIGDYAFSGCSGLTSVTIPNSVTSIGEYAFCGCSGLTSVTIPNSVTSIGRSAFSGCSGLTSVTIPNSVTSIGYTAFMGCTNLQMITLGPSLTEVGDYAFYDCKRISEITCYARVTPDAYKHTFEGISRMAYLYVPAGSVRAYMIDSNWGVFDIHEIGADSITVTGNGVLVEPSDNEAIFTWPMSDGASTYSLTITKNGIAFCTLTFNANGQLTNIAFAPSRNGNQHAPAAALTENGYQFTVTGLDYATNYAFSLYAKDAAAQVVASYSGTFHTNGATALEDVQPSGMQIQKILRDGVLYIITPDGTFDATGRRVEK